MRTSFCYTKNRLLQLVKSKQFYAFIIFTLATCFAAMAPLRNMCGDIGYRVSWGCFPLFLTSEFYVSLQLGAAILYADAPFINSFTTYELIRGKRGFLFTGHCLYIVLLSAMYVLFLFVVCLALLFPYVTFTSGWGKVLESVAHGGLNWQYNLGLFKHSSRLIINFTPLATMVRALLMSFLQFSLLGFVMQFLALSFPKRKYVHGVFALAYIFLPEVMLAFGDPTWVKFLPSGWQIISFLDLQNNSKGRLMNIPQAFVFLGVIIIFAAIMSIRPVKNMDIYDYLGESK